jgi:hypothetical protein
MLSNCFIHVFFFFFIRIRQVLTFRGSSHLDELASNNNLETLPCELHGSIYGQCHSGWLQTWHRNRHSVLRELGHAVYKHQYRGNMPLLYVAGHSVGGAYAQLAALEIGTLYTLPQRRPRIQHIHLVLLGAPRVGDAVFMQNFQMLTPQIITTTRYLQQFSEGGPAETDTEVDQRAFQAVGFVHVAPAAMLPCVDCHNLPSRPDLVLRLHHHLCYVDAMQAAFGMPPPPQCSSTSDLANSLLQLSSV